MIEDEDVVWKGSPLHKHLQGQGLDDDEYIEDRNEIKTPEANDQHNTNNGIDNGELEKRYCVFKNLFYNLIKLVIQNFLKSVLFYPD